jgi:type I restriction enzyme S subunit
MADLSTSTHDAQSVQTAESLITQNIDIWTTAIEQKSTAGRGSSKKFSLYGIKKLRELILELAVRGKLVPQASREARNSVEYEPASVLLERIAAEKAQLVKEGKLKKQKPLPEISDDEKPFELPVGWEWVFFGDICEIERGGSPRPIKSFITEESNGLNWIKIGDTEIGGKYITKAAEKIRPEGLRKTRQVFPGDFLLTNSMSFGRPYITKIEGCIHDGWLRISPPKPLDKDYLFNLLSSPFIVRSFKKSAAGAVVMNLNAEKVKETIIAVPPTEEQHRIVAKVDELMSLCDALEAQTEASISAHQTLVETLLNALLQPNQPAASLEPALNDRFVDSWDRVAEHFDTLFTTAASIDTLKQTILQLAVMGKLVPQASLAERNSPDYEPAAKLLERIKTEKNQLIKDKKIKKEKPLPSITDEEKPFELPQGWEWVRFASMSDEVATGPFGLMIHKRDYIENGVPLINPSHMINSRIKEDLGITVNKVKANELSSYTLFENDIVMARRGEMGRCALVTEREEGWLCGTGSFVLRFNQILSREYILLMFKTNYVREYLGGESIGTTMTNLNHGILNKMPLLLPPVEEQHRIVARVDELMALCDQLKARLSDAQTTQLHLTDAIVEQAV